MVKILSTHFVVSWQYPGTQHFNWMLRLLLFYVVSIMHIGNSFTSSVLILVTILFIFLSWWRELSLSFFFPLPSICSHWNTWANGCRSFASSFMHCCCTIYVNKSNKYPCGVECLHVHICVCSSNYLKGIV